MNVQCAVLVVHLAHQSEDTYVSSTSVVAKCFFSQTFFVMNKECTMRAPKVRSYGAQSLVRVPKVRLYRTRPSLHDRAGTFASFIYNCI